MSRNDIQDEADDLLGILSSPICFGNSEWKGLNDQAIGGDSFILLVDPNLKSDVMVPPQSRKSDLGVVENFVTSQLQPLQQIADPSQQNPLAFARRTVSHTPTSDGPSPPPPPPPPPPITKSSPCVTLRQPTSQQGFHRRLSRRQNGVPIKSHKRKFLAISALQLPPAQPQEIDIEPGRRDASLSIASRSSSGVEAALSDEEVLERKRLKKNLNQRIYEAKINDKIEKLEHEVVRLRSQLSGEREKNVLLASKTNLCQGGIKSDVTNEREHEDDFPGITEIDAAIEVLLEQRRVSVMESQSQRRVTNLLNKISDLMKRRSKRLEYPLENLKAISDSALPLCSFLKANASPNVGHNKFDTKQILGRVYSELAAKTKALQTGDEQSFNQLRTVFTDMQFAHLFEWTKTNQLCLREFGVM